MTAVLAGGIGGGVAGRCVTGGVLGGCMPGEGLVAADAAVAPWGVIGRAGEEGIPACGLGVCAVGVAAAGAGAGAGVVG
jgi:hypothetical protein